MASLFRSLVSKKKRRYNLDGFDLDLTYITDRIIAMGYPSESFEGMYRNKMTDVVRFLDARHPTRYKVYNLCSERSYDASKFQDRVAIYPFDDHNAPPIELMEAFCLDAESWLNANPKNVIAVHCKAGKGRTGVMVCALLLHMGRFTKAKDALEFYGEARTKNGKGVTIPSQRRYIEYYEHWLRRTRAPNPLVAYEPTPMLLKSISMTPAPNMLGDSSTSYYSYVDIKIGKTKVFSSESVKYDPKRDDGNGLQFRFDSSPVPLCADVKLEFYAGKKSKGKGEKVCHTWINTYYMMVMEEYNSASEPAVPMSPRRKKVTMALDDAAGGNELRFTLLMRKEEVDKACKDKSGKTFPHDMVITMEFINPMKLLETQNQQPFSRHRISCAGGSMDWRNMSYGNDEDGTNSIYSDDD